MTANNFLTDPDNATAFAHLTAVPIGSVRTWAKSLGWSDGKMQRFLKAVVRYRLATVEAQHRRSVFRPCVKTDVSHRIVSHRIGNQVPSAGLTTSRFGGSPGRAEKHEWGESLIATMNGILMRQFPESFVPVRSDNNGSHRAARRFAEAGIPSLEEAVSVLRGRVVRYNPSSIPDFKGDLPRTVGFFTKAVLAEWRRLERDREQLPLLPAMALAVEPRESSRMLPTRPDLPPSTPEEMEAALAEGREEYLRIAGCALPPRRM